jgi:hypothetical protein
VPTCCAAAGAAASTAPISGMMKRLEGFIAYPFRIA